MNKAKKDILVDFAGVVLFLLELIITGMALPLAFIMGYTVRLIYHVIKYRPTVTEEPVTAALYSKDREALLEFMARKLKRETYLMFFCALFFFSMGLRNDMNIVFNCSVLCTIDGVCNMIEDYQSR